MNDTTIFSSEKTQKRAFGTLCLNCTCTDLTQPVIVTLTVDIVPGPDLIPVVCSEFSTRFVALMIVWLSFLPVLEVYLLNRKKTTNNIVCFTMCIYKYNNTEYRSTVNSPGIHHSKHNQWSGQEPEVQSRLFHVCCT